VWGLVAQHVVTVATMSLAMWLEPGGRPRFGLGGRELGEMLRFGGHSIGALFLVFALRRGFVILCGGFLGAEAAGYLNMSLRVVDVFWQISSVAVSQVALPVLAAVRADPPRFRAALERAIGWSTLVFYALFATLGALSAEVVAVLFGAKWASIAPYVTVLALTVAVQAPRLMLEQSLTAVGRPRDNVVVIAVVIGAVLAAVAATRVPGVLVAVLVYAGAEAIGWLASTVLVARAIGFGVRAQLRLLAVPVAVAAGTAAAARWAAGLPDADLGAAWRLAVALPCAALAFAALAFALEPRVRAAAGGFAGRFARS
jgi:PST family polysaccharide transporter